MMTKPITPREVSNLDPLELRRKISVAQAAEMNCMHPDTFKRCHGHLIKRISRRRLAVELGDAIALPPKP